MAQDQTENQPRNQPPNQLQSQPRDQLGRIHNSFATRAELEAHLNELYGQLQGLGSDNSADGSRLKLDIARMLLALGDDEAAWKMARPCIDDFIGDSMWESAVVGFDLLYQCDQPKSVVALGMGCWLAITYPISPVLSIEMMNHIIDDTPDASDGAAVAAAVAYYIADLRAAEEQRDNLLFRTRQKIAEVAKRHRNIDDSDTINVWMDMYGLKDPAIFFPRMRTVIDAMVGEEWWFDRDRLSRDLPSTDLMEIANAYS